MAQRTARCNGESARKRNVGNPNGPLVQSGDAVLVVFPRNIRKIIQQFIYCTIWEWISIDQEAAPSGLGRGRWRQRNDIIAVVSGTRHVEPRQSNIGERRLSNTPGINSSFQFQIVFLHNSQLYTRTHTHTHHINVKQPSSWTPCSHRPARSGNDLPWLGWNMDERPPRYKKTGNGAELCSNLMGLLSVTTINPFMQRTDACIFTGIVTTWRLKLSPHSTCLEYSETYFYLVQF